MIKNRFLFILGRQSDLALAEVVSVLKTRQIRYEPFRLASHELILNVESEISNPQALLNILGGTIKIVRLDDQLPLRHQTEFKAQVVELLKGDTIAREYADKKEGRWTFGISVYAPLITASTRDNLGQLVHQQGLEIKNYFKARKRSTRYVAVRGNSSDLSSVVVRKNKLLRPDGVEITLLLTNNAIVRGYTVAVQDFEAYSERDYGRPARDPRVGSLPPKLAQMLLNLALVPTGGRVHDPFVGIGTVVQEGLLQGLAVSGSDNSAEQIAHAQKNMQWLRTKYPALLTTTPDAMAQEIFIADAKDFGSLLGKGPAKNGPLLDAIVSEGMLGPPQSKPMPPAEAEKVAKNIAELWVGTLEKARDALVPNGRIVATLPVLKTTSGDVFAPLLDELPSLGYRVDPLLPSSLVTSARITPRQTLIYERQDQIVRREVVRLVKI